MTQNQNIRLKKPNIDLKNYFLNEVIRVFMGHPKPLAFKFLKNLGMTPPHSEASIPGVLFPQVLVPHVYFTPSCGPSCG